MRGFIVGLFLLPLIVIGILSVRPGGLRNQLRNVARRFRLALVLAGVYMLGSAGLRLAFAGGPVLDYGLPGLGVALAVVFVALSPDRPPP
ncbi:MAG TPA: hypothetical protein VK131_03405 [Candidatus Acidoferrales bacterium]|nr:hypothetical protein [Candidatus Acidoferrales bacterium]